MNCPHESCDYESSKQGVKIHYGRSHEGTISGVLVDCAWCGETNRKDEYRLERSENLFCDPECRANWAEKNMVGENAGGWRGGDIEFECANCGATDSMRPSMYERSERHFCSTSCMSQQYSETGEWAGENSPTWNGGGRNYYGPNWDKERERCLERDNHRCRGCGMTNHQHKKTYGRGLHAHHVRPLKEFEPLNGPEDYALANKLTNLVSYCTPCHKKWEKMPIAPPSPKVSNK